MVDMQTKKRQGFFFALMALAMLSLVITMVQIWTKTAGQEDYFRSHRFKGEAMRSIIYSVSDRSLSEFARASAFYAAYKLANYSSDFEIGGIPQMDEGAPPNNPKTGKVSKAAFELMRNGSSEPNSGFPINYSQEEKAAYTIWGWMNRTGEAAKSMGFEIEFSEPENFVLRQADPWTVEVSFEIGMNITDSERTMRQNKRLKAHSNFTISGFLDPMITRKDMEYRNVERGAAVEKQIFLKSDYKRPADVKPILIDGSGREGHGWSFGKITTKYPNEFPAQTDLKQYILVRSYDDYLPSYADAYGGVIVTTAPMVIKTECEEIQTRCLNCMKRVVGGPGCPPPTNWEPYPNNNPVSVPVVVASNEWNISKVATIYRTDSAGNPVAEQYVLIDNGFEDPDEKLNPDSYHRIWDITKLRDMAICGFYVKGNGPSFFQRMVAGAESLKSEELGLESFVVGKWAGGEEDKDRNPHSRLDWEYYTATTSPVSKIKGMMGCKNKEMCNDDEPVLYGTGHFKLSYDALGRYFARNISCVANHPSAPC